MKMVGNMPRATYLVRREGYSRDWERGFLVKPVG